MEIVDKLHRERVSQRGMARVTGSSRPTITRWLRKKRAIFSTDEYFIYRQVLPATRHRPRPKGHGATSQVDRAHNTFCQWCANLVRKTLSFSRDVHLHAVRLRIVVDAYNAERADIW
jgi:IS1 family transposase